VKVSVVIVTYRRAWALRHCLEGLAKQTLKPDEVVVVLKPSGDGSEEVLHKYMSKLPIKVVIQREGNAPKAYTLGVKNASGDIVLFIDDDAVAHEEWVERYVKLFNMLKDAGGVGGLCFKAYLSEDNLLLTNEVFSPEVPTKDVLYRKPLKEYEGYCVWLSKSGFMGARICEEGLVKSMEIGGVNMAFRRDLIEDCPLDSLYGRSRKAFMFEQVLAHYVRRKGYHIYKVRVEKHSPLVYHIVHKDSLTRKPGFQSEFWLHYDRVVMYWRLKRLGADVSAFHYLLALLFTLRRKTIPGFLATVYGLAVGSIGSF